MKKTKYNCLFCTNMGKGGTSSSNWFKRSFFLFFLSVESSRTHQAYLGHRQTSLMEIFWKMLTAFNDEIFSQKRHHHRCLIGSKIRLRYIIWLALNFSIFCQFGKYYLKSVKKSLEPISPKHHQYLNPKFGLNYQ